MNTKTSKKNITSLSASEMLPLGLSVESLKRMRAVSARFADVGFPSGIEKELNNSIIAFSRNNSILNGDVQVTC